MLLPQEIRISQLERSTNRANFSRRTENVLEVVRASICTKAELVCESFSVAVSIDG